MTFSKLAGLVWFYKDSMLHLGNALVEARKNYKDLVGEGIDTWYQFLEQPEIGLTVREANTLMEVAEYMKGMEVDITDLNLATVKFAASKGIVEPDLVEDMKVLSLRDFKERHFDHTTEEKGQRTYSYLLMKKCNETGSLSRVYGDEILEAKKKIDG